MLNSWPSKVFIGICGKANLLKEKNGKALEGKTQLAYAFDYRP